jgi:hypothetical protein
VDTRGSGNGTQFKSTHLVNRISVGCEFGRGDVADARKSPQSPQYHPHSPQAEQA